MNEMKIRAKSPEHSKAIQEKLFSMGHSWAGLYGETYARFTSMPYLYFSDKGIQMSAGGDIGDKLFAEDNKPEYVFEDGEFKPKQEAA